MSTRRRHIQSSYNQSESDHHNSFTEPRSQTFVTDNNPGYSQTFQDTSEPDMTCRDRTNEFMSAVKSMQSRQVCIHVCLWFVGLVLNVYESHH